MKRSRSYSPFLLLYVGTVFSYVAAARHRYTFDDAGDLGQASGAPHAVAVGSVHYRERGGVRSGGYVELSGGHLLVGEADQWQVGTDFSVTMWVRPRSLPGTLFSIGGVRSQQACAAWSAPEIAYLPDRPPLRNHTTATMVRCKESCAEDASCTAVSFDAAEPRDNCNLYDCEPGEEHCAMVQGGNTTVRVVRCSRENPSLSVHLTSSGVLGVSWNGGFCEMAGVLQVGAWSLVSFAVSTDTFRTHGVVRLSRMSPGVEDVACYSEKWHFPQGLPFHNGYQAAVGYDLTRMHPFLAGDIDDFTVSHVGADVGALTKQIGVDLGVIFEEHFASDSYPARRRDIEVNRGGGLKGNSLRVNMDSALPANAAHRVEADFASLGALPEFSVCAWIKPMCVSGSCGRPWTLRNPATGKASMYLELKGNGEVAHMLHVNPYRESVVSTSTPSWTGCYVATEYVKETAQRFDLFTVHECGVQCATKYFFLGTSRYACHCSDTHPSLLMKRAPDHQCDIACWNEVATESPTVCKLGSEDKLKVAAYEHIVAARYDLSPLGTRCAGGLESNPTSEEECVKAAGTLGITTTLSSIGWPWSYPPGCLWNGGTQLYWNPPSGADTTKPWSYYRLCRSSENNVWKQGRWQWYCATKDLAGVHRLYVDGAKAWEAPATLQEFSFRDGDVFELGGGGHSAATQFRGEIDGLRVSRKAEPAQLEGHQMWRLRDLNRVYHTGLLEALNTGLVEFNATGDERVSAYIAASVDLRGRLVSWRVRHAAAFVDMDAVMTTSPLANRTNGPLLHNGLLATQRQQYGNSSSLLVRNARNLVAPDAYAGSCPAVTLLSSSADNYTVGRLRSLDGVSWEPWLDASWVQWSYAQSVEFVGLEVKFASWNHSLNALPNATLELLTATGEWVRVYSFRAEGRTQLQTFTGWGVHSAMDWRLSIAGVQNLAVDYLGPVLLGFSSPCGSPSEDCSYPYYAKGVSLDEWVNATGEDNGISELSADNMYFCRDACNDEPVCASYAYHADTYTCRLSRGIAYNVTSGLTGWVSYSGKTGCASPERKGSSDSNPVDTTVIFHPLLGGTTVKAERTAYARGGPAVTSSAMRTVDVGVRCGDENSTTEGLANKLLGAFPLVRQCELFCQARADCHYCAPSVCYAVNGTWCSYAPLRTCHDMQAMPADSVGIAAPLRAKPTHWHRMSASGPSQSRCDAGCALCGARQCTPRSLNMRTLLNDTSDESLSGVHFGVRGVFRLADPQAATALSTSATFTYTLSHSYTLPSGTSSASYTLSQSLSTSGSLSGSLSRSLTVLATDTVSQTLSMPTSTYSATPTLPSATNTRTSSISPSFTKTETYHSSTLSTITLSLTLPTHTLSMSLPTVTVSGTPTTTITVPTGTWTFETPSVTITLPSATVTHTTTNWSPTLTHTQTFTMTLPTMSATVDHMYGSVSDYSSGVSATYPYMEEQELVVFDTDLVARVVIDPSDCVTLPNGKIVSGNFETSGDAQRCMNASETEVFCLTPATPAATGAVHLAAPLDTKDRVLRIYARFGVGGHSHNAAGSWVIALHKVGPILGTYGTGYLHGLANTDWTGLTRGLYIIFDATVTDHITGGRVMVVSDADNGDALYERRTALRYTDTIATPGMQWCAWVDVYPTGDLRVYVTTNSTAKPHLPLVDMSLDTSLDTLLGGGATTPTYVSTLAASACGEVTVTVRAGFYLKTLVTLHPYPKVHYPEKHTEIEVIVKGETLRFGYRPGYATGDARVVVNNNATTVFSGRDMGWTPMTDTMHTMRVTLRTGGMHTVAILSSDGLDSWSEDFTSYGLWTANSSVDDVQVVMNVDGGFIYEEGAVHEHKQWWAQGTYDLTADPGVVKTISDLRRFYWWNEEANAYHKAALETVSCAAVQHILHEVTAETEDYVVPDTTGVSNASRHFASIAEVQRGAVLLPGDTARHVYVPLHHYLPGTAFAVEMWLLSADAAKEKSGIVAYTRPMSTAPHFQIHDEGSHWVVTILKEALAFRVRDVWAPLTSLAPATYGYKCGNADSAEDILVGGTSFSTAHGCEVFCANNEECAVCTPYRCDVFDGTCLCSFRALQRCVGTAVLQAGCSHQMISKKEAGWVHFAFKWRSLDGCWAMFRDGVEKFSGCGFATGVQLPAGGNLILGQRVTLAGLTDPSAEFHGAVAHAKLWDGFPSDAYLSPFAVRNHFGNYRVAGSWPLLGNLSDVSGNNRHMHYAGTAPAFLAFPPTLPAVTGKAAMRNVVDAMLTPAEGPALKKTFTDGGRQAIYKDAEAPVADALPKVLAVRMKASVAADVDGDGVDDVVMIDANGAVGWVGGMDVTAALKTLTVHPIGTVDAECATTVHAADINADGVVDVYAVCQQSVHIWRGQGGAAFELEVVTPNWAVPSLGSMKETMPTPEPFNGVCIADVDGDSVNDIVVSFTDTTLQRNVPPVHSATPLLRMQLDGNTNGDAGQQGLTDTPPLWDNTVKAEGVGAAHFDGTGRCGYGPTITTTTTTLTWSAWVMLDKLYNGTGATVVDYSNGNTTLFGISIDSDGSAACVVGGVSVVALPYVTLLADSWYLLSCVWDGNKGTLKAYQNGRSQGAMAVQQETLDLASYRITVGCATSINASNTTLSGYVDDVRVYAHAFSTRDTLLKIHTSLHLPFDSNAGYYPDGSGLARLAYAPDPTRVHVVPQCAVSSCISLDEATIIGDSLADLVQKSEQLTLALWVRLPAGWENPTNSQKFPLLGSAAGDFGVYYNPFLERVTCVFTCDSVVVMQTSTIRVSSGQWVHVACTLSGQTGTTTVYIDMVPESSNTTVAPLRLSPPATALQIGGGSFRGDIDDVRIMYTAVQPAEFVSVFAPPAALAYHIQERLYFGWNDTADAAVTDRLVSLPAIPVAGAMTVSFWVLPTRLPLASSSMYSTTCLLHLGNEALCVSRSGILVRTAFWEVSLPEARWTHIAFRYSGTHASLFVDGTQHHRTVVTSLAWSGVGTLGGSLEGWLQDVRVYSTELTVSQVAGLARSGSVAYIPGTGAVMRGTATFADRMVSAPGGRLSGVLRACVDYDNDGDIDIVLSAQGGASYPLTTLLVNSGVGQFTHTTLAAGTRTNTLSLSPAFVSVFTPSLTHDSTPDLVSVRADGAVHVVRSSGARYLRSVVEPLCEGSDWFGTEVWGRNTSCTVHAICMEHGGAGYHAVLEVAERWYVASVALSGSHITPRYSVPTGVVHAHCAKGGIFLSTEETTYLSAQPTSPEDDDDSAHLLLHMPFDEESGTHVSNVVSGSSGAIIDATPQTHPVHNPIRWLAGGGLWLNSFGLVAASFVSGPLHAMTVSVWTRLGCASSVPRFAHIVDIDAVFSIVVNGSDIFVLSPADDRRLCGARLNMLACTQRPSWHLVSVAWEAGQGFRISLNGRAVLACGEDAISYEPATDLGVYSVTIGRGFSGAIRGLRVEDVPVSQAALMAMYHASMEGTVPQFVPENFNMCPVGGGWQAKPYDANSCGRAFGMAHITHNDAVHRCRARGACSWAVQSAEVPDAAVYSVLTLAGLRACRESCCDDTACRAVLWEAGTASSGRCSLISTIRDITASAFVERPTLSVLVRPDAAYHFAFDTTLHDSVTSVALSTVGSSEVIFEGGRVAGGVELADGQRLSATLDGAVSYQMWSLSLWAKPAAVNGTRCHVSLNSAVHICEGTAGAELRIGDVTHALDGVVADNTWHHYELAFDGRDIHFSRDCNKLVEVTTRANNLTDPYLVLLGVGGDVDTSIGRWLYDDLVILPHFVKPCAAAHIQYADMSLGGRLAAVSQDEDNDWLTSLAGGPVWLPDTYRRDRGNSFLSDTHQCSAQQPWPTVFGGEWRCSERVASAVCEADAVEKVASSAPVLSATLGDVLPEHSAEGVWKTLLYQEDESEGGGYFPMGRFVQYGSERESLYVDLAPDWRQYRHTDGTLELRLSFPLGACDGTTLSDIVWRQSSLPTASGATEGYRAVHVPIPAVNGVVFTGLSRSTSGVFLLQSHAVDVAYGVGAQKRQGCGLAGPTDAGVHALKLSVRIPHKEHTANPVTVAFWVKARAEPHTAAWRKEAMHDCPGPQCGCEKGAKVHTGRFRRSAVAAAWTDGAQRAALSSSRAALPGGVWTCDTDNSHPAHTTHTLGNWQSFRPATRRYGVFSYWRDGAAAPDIAMSCEGSGPRRGACEISVGNPGSAENARTYVNAPQLVKNMWAGDEWHHFALTWEAQEGCYALYVDGAMSASGCGHNVGGGVGAGGHFLLGHAASGPKVPEEHTALFGSIADFTFWGQRLDPQDIKTLAAGDTVQGYIVKWRLEAPHHLKDEAGHTDLAQDGAFSYFAQAPHTEADALTEPRVSLPGVNLAGLWTGNKNVEFTDGAAGVSVCFWHKSLDAQRAVFSYTRQGSVIPELAMTCVSHTCYLEMGTQRGHSMHMADSLLSQYWTHCCVAVADGSARVFVNGTAAKVSGGVAHVVAASAGVHSMDAANVVDGVVNVTDAGGCYSTGANTTDWLRLRLSATHTVTSVRMHAGSFAGENVLATGWDVRVGRHGSTADPLCKQGVSVLGHGPHVVTCTAPLAGHYVSIHSSSGLALCEVAVSTAGLARIASSGVFRLGTYYKDEEDMHFAGSLSDVRVFTKALSHLDVQRERVAPAPDAKGLWAWWKFDTLHDASQNGHALSVTSPTHGGLAGRWSLLFRQKYPSSWTDRFEKVSDGMQYAALGRLAEEHRWKDGRFVFAMKWADLPAGEVWSQTTDPTVQRAVEGFASETTQNELGYGFGGLHLDETHESLLVGVANATQYSVGTLAWDSAPAYPGATSKEVLLYSWDSDACDDHWNARLNLQCTQRYFEYALPLDGCKALCRSTQGCTGVSFEAELCRVHAPGVPSAVDVVFTADINAVNIVYGVEVLVPGHRLWGDVNVTQIPQEMLGAKVMMSNEVWGTNSSLSVSVNESSLLYVIHDHYNESLGDVLHTTMVLETENTTLHIMKIPIGRGVFNVPLFAEPSYTPSRVSLAVKALNAGEDPSADCIPQHSDTARYFSLTRACSARYEHVADTQCHAGADCDACIGEGVFAASLAECAESCRQARGCNFFTLYENGWCATLRSCDPFYESGWSTRGGCVTYVMKPRAALAFDTAPEERSDTDTALTRTSYISQGGSVSNHPVAYFSTELPRSFTAEWWMKPYDADCGCAPLSVTSLSSDTFALELDSGTIKAIVIHSTRVELPTPDVLIRTGEWVHIAISWNSETQMCTVFVDGVKRVWTGPCGGF